MERRITKYLLLLLIVNDFIQAVPKIEFNRRSKDLNNKPNKKLQHKVKERSRKEGDDEDGPPAAQLEDTFSEVNGNGGSDENRNAGDQDEENTGLFENGPFYSNLESDEHKKVETKVDLAEAENRPKESSFTPKPDVSKQNTGSDVKKFKNKQSRPLQVGDTITPEELLEVTNRIISKVEKPGSGKGIVSSSKNQYDLADKLFERFFMTSKRIITIKGMDIDGLDAFQALSLDGDVINALRSSSESFTEAPSVMFRGFKKEPNMKLYGTANDDYPDKCHYKVLRKWIKEKPTSKKGEKNTRLRGANKLKKTLGKNRDLVVNPGRRELAKKKVVKGKYNHRGENIEHIKTIKNKSRARVRKTSKNKSKKNYKKSQRTSNQKKISSSNAKNTADNGVICRWKYRCNKEFHLHTCRLHSVCSNQTEYKSSFIEEEPNINLRKFREMVGLSLLDEKVEKIIEAHVMKIRPQNLKPDQHIEDLMRYFNKIVDKNSRFTTPMTSEGNSAKNPDALSPDSSDADNLDPIKTGGETN